ncbi:hypothetical protein FHS83_000403 [Rhizomicrobium palustre]|uniref:Sulfotransferase family protein n=1 Tax=Rhizomicrobium palustre TaxID=189966 RepID=A0A846MV34_9PROT|nr:hypothetical protein [Rhizomicrobium palustre]NIK87085.1 hypothetical protein [Rhizomicrobium palustre]
MHRRALYVRSDDVEAVKAAPFYYLHLRRTAGRIVSVPLEHGPLLPAAKKYADPVFLFSPGRVGSTLIARVLAEAGVPSVSEPDFYSQLVHPLLRRNPLARPFRAAMWNLSGDLSAALGASPVIKLRAECARAPELFVRNPKAKTIVLFRGFEAWARSTAQVFGAGPEKAVRKYLTALKCYETLCQTSDCHLMRFEDWVSAPSEAAAALAAFLNRPLAPEAVRRALSQHSQEGTPLLGRRQPGWEGKWQAALALWRSKRVERARGVLQIPVVWD